MKTAEIAQRYLNYFEKNGHTIVPSASLVSPDPALLFVNAGMVPFKPYFRASIPRRTTRAADIQKCVRTHRHRRGRQDHPPRHVLPDARQLLVRRLLQGEARSSYAWELLTTPEADGRSTASTPRSLWVTVYEEDDEAHDLWREIAGIPRERIQRLGMADNYWSMGRPGPCGPCSEIFFDRGPEYGIDGGPAADDDRYVEIWNLVFMQYEIAATGRASTTSRSSANCPQKNIDTGMGLERVACILQGVDNMYETDQVRPVLDKAVELSGKTYGANHEDDVRFRVVADHVRSSLMLIGDGVTPSQRGPRLHPAPPAAPRHPCDAPARASTGPTFAELLRDVAGCHEGRLPRGRDRLGRASRSTRSRRRRRSCARSPRARRTSMRRSPRAKAAGATRIGGAEAFLLHDTYGFPIDLTLEIADEPGSRSTAARSTRS